MNVFVSWSGKKSLAVAEVLHKYLPSMVNQVRPWLSRNGIETGARWSPEIAEKLESANVGIICLTAENQNAPWINFEAGAISKLTNVGRAMVLRVDLTNADITGPLSQFQSVSLDRMGIWTLVADINKAAGNALAESSLQITFEALWPAMESEFNRIESDVPSVKVPPRKAESMLDELLMLVRNQEIMSFQMRVEILDSLSRLQTNSSIYGSSPLLSTSGGTLLTGLRNNSTGSVNLLENYALLKNLISQRPTQPPNEGEVAADEVDPNPLGEDI